MRPLNFTVRRQHMDALSQVFPELAASVSAALERMGKTDLARECLVARIFRVTFDVSVDAAYIYLNELGPDNCESVPLEMPRWMIVLDTVSGRPQGLEWLSPPEPFKAELRARAAV